MDSTSHIRTDLVDIVTPSRRGASVYKSILEEASENPNIWMRHHFIVAFDVPDDNEAEKLNQWLHSAREILPIPRVTILTAEQGNRNNANALRQQALKKGVNPYIYFQDDDDQLPLNLDLFIDTIEKKHWDVLYGVTETVNIREQVIEQFPQVHNSQFTIDPEDACKWFPTYSHPLAGLFKRSLIEVQPIDNGESYHFNTGCPFQVRLTHESNVKIGYYPQVIRHVKHHEDNDSGILGGDFRTAFAADIKQWSDHIQNEDIKAFHLEVAEALERGWVTTFREIGAMVETKIGY